MRVFQRLRTQWRVSGMGELTGLDYTAVLAVIDRMGLPRDEAEDLFQDIQHIEGGALDAMRRGSS